MGEELLDATRDWAQFRRGCQSDCLGLGGWVGHFGSLNI